MTATSFAWLVIAFPLAGSIVIALGFRHWRGRTAGWIASAAIGLAFASSIGALIDLQSRSPDARSLTSSLWDYAATAGVNVKLQILVDPLAVFMCLVVSGVSFLIHVYSVAYMDSDRGYSR
jgi:NADH-quinone oxidoreductase subunit L